MTQALVLTVLTNYSPERLQKAVCGLGDGTMTVTITRQTETELRALVKSGTSEYGVTLSASLTSCSCKDSLYRGVVCKHSIALALTALQVPAAPEQPQQIQQPQPAPSAPCLTLSRTRREWAARSAV